LPYSIKILRSLEEIDPKLKGIILDLLEEIEKNTRETVKRSDFDELKAAFVELTRTVRELAEAQKRSEERLTKLEITVQELAEAQKKTEERVNELAEAQKRSEERLTKLEITVQELAEAQKRSEERLTKLEITVQELAEAQKKTEERVNELAEAQKRSEERLTKLEITVQELAEAQKRSEERLTKLEIAVEKLAEAQKKTEETLNKLIKRVDIIEERLEGISNSVGYSLENNTYKSLPVLLNKEGIEVEGRLIRRYYEDNQLNIWGKGKKNGKTLLILGEVKVRPSRKEIDKFLRLVDTITKKEKKDAFPVFVAHDYHPNTERYLNEKGIKYYWSYELE